ncbi:MAG: hypothetical protein HY876_06355 [Coriobacteriales bacterium]|nr:hypothetical protein [Coriobacteriales bacterium]
MPDLEIVSEQGVIVSQKDLDEIVVRRREEGFASGSEVAILPGHAPLLMKTGSCLVRWRRGEEWWGQHVPQGVCEVADDRVTLVVTRSQHVV